MKRFFLLVAVLLLVGACGSSKSPSAPAGSGGASGGKPALSATVTLQNLKFDPATVTIARGGAVTWEWKEAVAHNVTSDGWKSDTKASGTYLHTFPRPGTYNYQCTIHAGMTGTVLVK